MYNSLPSPHVVILGIDVSTRSSESGIEWECLIEAVCHVQLHVLGQSTVVGVEVLVVPLE